MDERELSQHKKEFNIELKGLKLDLIDLMEAYNCSGIIRYLYQFDNDLDTLVGLPREDQQKALKDIALRAFKAYPKA